MLDWREVGRVAREADWWLVGPALLTTAISYYALSAGLVAIGRIVGVRLRRGVFLRIAFISVAVNHVFSMGGVAGYSLRTALIVRQGEGAAETAAMSLLHSYLNNVILVALLQVGLVALALGPSATPGLRETLLLLAVVSTGLIALSTAAIFSNPLRGRLLGLIGRLARPFPDRWRHRVLSFSSAIDLVLGQAGRTVRTSPRTAVAPTAWLLVDWFATFATLWFCLDAFGDSVSPAVLIGGGALGLTAGFVSVIPGGLGVQEGSLAVVFSAFGVQLEQAVLAAVLFRLVYYIVPFVASLPLYAGATRLATPLPTERAEPSPEF